jgi:hypothetical protein
MENVGCYNNDQHFFSFNVEELVIYKYNSGKSTNMWSGGLEFELEKNINRISAI